MSLDTYNCGGVWVWDFVKNLIMICSKMPINTLDKIDISHKTQPTVEFLYIPIPMKLIKNASDGKFEKQIIRSQSFREILPFLYSDIAEFTEDTYPPTSPKKNGGVAFLLTPKILLIGACRNWVMLLIAPDSVAISEAIINGKREGMMNETHCFNEFDTEM